MKLPTFVTAFVVALLLAACPKPTPGPTPNPGDDPCATLPDGQPCPDDPCALLPWGQECPFQARHASCDRACRHGVVLGCPWANPSPGGVSCAEVCETVRTSGAVTWNLACRQRATTCHDVDACEGGR